MILGYTAEGRPVSVAVRDRNILIVGDSRTGKSWVAGALCEQLIRENCSVFVLESEGDYWALGRLPGVITLGGQRMPPDMHEVTVSLRHPDLSVVIDLSKMDGHDKRCYGERLLAYLSDLRQRTG